MASWFRSRPRRATAPRRPHGATSAHMWFHDLPPGPWRSVSATLEIVTEPRADSLYFWALQATFTDGTGAPHGVAHTGLQWNPRHPGNRAVNWGGYRQAADVTSILDGTHSALPGIPGDENTRNFAWRAGVGYRFTIARGDQGWRSTVTDLETGAQTVIRELLAAGDRLAGFVVWMEVFAPCDAPTTTVRWSDLEMADDDRQARHSVRSVATSFPDAAGGCTNNDSRVDGNGGWLQLTNDERTAATATVLSVD